MSVWRPITEGLGDILSVIAALLFMGAVAIAIMFGDGLVRCDGQRVEIVPPQKADRP